MISTLKVKIFVTFFAFFVVSNNYTNADLSIINGYTNLCKQCIDTVQRLLLNPSLISTEELPAKFLYAIKNYKGNIMVCRILNNI